MENMIPFLLVAGGLIYKIYQNYQEEMEKAKKRQKKLGETIPPTPAATPKTQKRSSERKPLFETPTIPIQKERSYSYDIPSEVTQIRQQREEKIAEQKISLTAESFPENETVPVAFDLRQAIIQAAILERPYQ